MTGLSSPFKSETGPRDTPNRATPPNPHILNPLFPLFFPHLSPSIPSFPPNPTLTPNPAAPHGGEGRIRPSLLSLQRRE